MQSPTAPPWHPPPLGRTLDFMRLLWATEHALQAASKRMEATLGITGPQRVTLRVIVKCPGLSAKRLAHTLQLHPSTLTGVLRRLEGRALIQRQSDPKDGRSFRLFATAAGRALTESPAGTVEASVRRALRGLEPHDLRAAQRVLAILAKTLAKMPAQSSKRELEH
jgi:MarR family transcriptional regulator, organic hydroperoxide resistance regulator